MTATIEIGLYRFVLGAGHKTIGLKTILGREWYFLPHSPLGQLFY